MKHVFPIFIVLISLIATSCGPSMKITGNWMNKEVVGKKKYQKVFLLVLSSNAAARQSVETAQEQACKEQGIVTVKSTDVFTPSFLASKPGQDVIVAKIKETGCDGIFTSALVDIKSETRYVPGTTTYTPYYGGYGVYGGYGAYGGFGTYYGGMSTYMYEPGYYTEDQTYFIESNFYDVESGEIVWSVQSEAYNPTDLDKISRQYAALLMDKLRREGVLGNK